MIVFIAVLSADVDQIAKDLKLTYDVVRNGVLTPYATVTYFANITLENVGQREIPSSGWSIYFCHHTLIQPVYYNVSTNQYIGGGLILSGNMTLSHVKGCMFKLDPYNGENLAFRTLPLIPGEIRNISFLASNWAISKYDVFPNWYLGNGSRYTVIDNTANDVPNFVAPHSTFVQFMRGVPNDVMSIPPTPFERYRGINFTALDDVKYSILPTPLKTSQRRGTVDIDNTWTIDINGRKSLGRLAGYLQKNIKGTKISKKKNSDSKVISLKIVKAPKDVNPEAYKLRVRSKPARVEISAYTNGGVFNGIQSLFSMLAFGGTIPAVSIFDQPRFSYRGLQLDVARNFFPKSTIYKLLDAMSLFKLNKLQLNLADDEGWRLAIEGLPELTDIAGKRCHDYSEKTCLFSQLGSDPSGTGVGSGFYTKQDYIDILKFARDRNIEVIPSINMGGRARAAVIAMNQRADQTKSDQYLMHDRNTDNIYLTDTLFDDSAINPCMKGTLNFFDHVVNYTTAIANIAWKYGINLSGFEEFFVAWPTTDPRGGPLVPFDRSRFPEKMSMSAITRNAQNDVFIQRATAFANNGYKVILSQSDFLSLDHAPEADPESPGDYWGIRYIDPLRVFLISPRTQML
ncbi:hypothetical protein FSP39_012487 [Pinctada imbricata]|uniref:beta-N-acetylhexosaminidase n=1 Tax=Pinctada imbricata TaxID=66713 RepID=A0AA88YJ17_PINIB|nr:hypothetical protein FSP39_012487 [Pinctada imbricata]